MPDTETMGIIYRYTFDNGKMYIGQTKFSLNYRHRQHLIGNMLVDKALRCHRYTLEVVSEVPIERLDDEEQRLIKEFNTEYPNGYNMTSGGQAKHTLNVEIRKKISIGNLGKPKSEQARKNMSKARMGKEPWNKGKTWSKETREKISKTLKAKETPKECLDALSRYYETHDVWNKGGTLPDELKQRISLKLKGNKRSPESIKMTADKLRGRTRPRDCIEKALRTKIEKGLTRRVRNIDTGQEFDTIEEAQRVTGANNIRLVLKGKTKRSGGYRWEEIE